MKRTLHTEADSDCMRYLALGAEHTLGTFNHHSSLSSVDGIKLSRPENVRVFRPFFFDQGEPDLDRPYEALKDRYRF